MNPTVCDRFRRLSRWLAAAAAAIGGLVLLGWILGNESWKSFLPGRSTMKANTAVAVMALSAALLLMGNGQAARPRRHIAKGLAALVLALGLVTLLEHLSGWTAGIDQLLFQEHPGPVASGAPGRLSQLAAINCLLLGVAVLCLDLRRIATVRISQTCSLVTIFLGFLGLLGYTLGVKNFYSGGFHTEMSFPAALSFVLGGIALLLARPERGWMAVVSSDRAGGVMLRRRLPVAVAAPWILGWLTLVGSRSGLYGVDNDQVFFAASLILVLIALKYVNAHSLNRVDAEREAQKLEVERLNRELEERVDRRTAELAGAVSALQAEMAERQRIEQKLRDEHHYTRSLLESSIDALATINPQGTVTDVNRQMELLTGRSRQQLIGTPFKQYFTDPARAEEGVQLMLRQGRVTDYELSALSRDGKQTPVDYNATTFYNQRQELQGVFAAARDITERKRAEAALRAAHDELEDRVRERTAELAAANQELEEFSSSVSHDLRAPLRHIESFARLLGEQHASQLDAEALHYLDRIRNGTQRMSHLVDDLLKLARVGRQALQLLPTSLGEVVAAVVRDLETGERQIEWRIGELPTVTCDPLLVKQVVFNLLANAVKFTRPRERAVIQVGQTESRGRRALFVRDNGVGFDMKYADRLFGAFQRLHRPEEFEGSGVGLATVWRIVRKHGGDIWAEAAPDQGATFYFSLGALCDTRSSAAAEEESTCTTMR